MIITVSNLMVEDSYRLSDGRQLCYAVYGSPEAQPVLYFHGTPSSRLEPLLLRAYNIDVEEWLQQATLKLIAVDRPGMGLSTFNPANNFLSFARDAHELLLHLSIQSCPVLCWSGGGPYALAIAHAYPELITSVHIICGFTKTFDKAVIQQMSSNKWYFLSAKRAPLLLKLSLAYLKNKNIKRLVPQQLTGQPYVDYALLQDPLHLKSVAEATMKEACRKGPKGPVAEARLYFTNFGFHVSDINQPVHYWWGTLDQTVVRLHAENIERSAPHAVMHYRQGEGHLSLYANCFKEMLQTISSTL